MLSQLARSLDLAIRGEPINVRTPLLIPSFSSKALVDIRPVFEALQASITESLLISAYDIFYDRINAPTSPFAEVLFIDSGGYEISKDYDIMDPMYPSPEAHSWSIGQYIDVLNTFNPVMPTFITSFDHPDLRQSLPQQIESALELFKEFPGLGRELLVKPETKDQKLVQISSVVSQVPRFSEFDAVGITETELGGTLLDRMANIARVRRAMDEEHVKKPLHIFGSLDPVCTPLYFLAGADIFDGLTWIRFSYMDDMAVYHRNRGPLEFGPKERENRALMRSYDSNLHYLTRLTERMQRYLVDGDVTRFERHADFYTTCIDDLRFKLKGVI